MRNLLESWDEREARLMMENQALTGKGYIVLEAPNYRLIEFASLADAQHEAARQAHRVGSAIIYEPIAIVQPRVNVSVRSMKPGAVMPATNLEDSAEEPDGNKLLVALGELNKRLAAFLPAPNVNTPQAPQEPTTAAQADGS